MRKTVFLLLSILIFSNCSSSIPEDSLGESPKEIVIQFLALCEAGEFLQAQELWTEESKDEFGSRESFEQRCREYVALQLKINDARYGKNKSVVYVSGHIQTEGKDEGKAVHFYFQLHEGKWKLAFPTTL